MSSSRLTRSPLVFLFVALLVLFGMLGLAPARTWGQGNVPDRGIGVSSSPAFYSCNIRDSGGVLEVFVVYTGLAVKGISFAAPMPACSQFLYLSDTNVFSITTGNSQTGVSVDFGNCLDGPVHVLTIRYFSYGLTPQCCVYPTLPVSGSEVEAVACDGIPVTVTRLCNYINQDSTCDCIFLGPILFLCPAVVVPVESTTWGQVKALYQ